MKKLLLLLILLALIIIPYNVKAAKTVKDFYCVYNIYDPYARDTKIADPNQDKTSEKILTQIKIEVDNYNGGSGSPTVKIYIKDNGNWKETTGAMIKSNYTGVTTGLNIFDGSSNEKNVFVGNYKTGGKCPRIYANKTAGMQTVTVLNYYTDENKFSYYNIDTAAEEKVRGDSGDWMSPDDFFKEDTHPDPSTPAFKEKTCDYQYNFENKVYNNLKITFSKTQNKQTGEPVYEVKLDREGQSQYVNLNEEVTIHAQDADIILKPAFLKKIFDGDECIAKDKTCSYWSDQKSKPEFILSDDFQECKNESMSGTYSDGDGTLTNPNTPPADITNPTIPEGNIDSCDELLGKNLSAIVKVAITILQIVAAIIAIVKGMMVLIPPILAKDADALKKAGSTLAKMAIILVIIFLFKPLLSFLGNLLDFDTSCIL